MSQFLLLPHGILGLVSWSCFSIFFIFFTTVWMQSVATLLLYTWYPFWSLGNVSTVFSSDPFISSISCLSFKKPISLLNFHYTKFGSTAGHFFHIAFWFTYLDPEFVSLLHSSAYLNPLWSHQTFFKVEFWILYSASSYFLIIRVWDRWGKHIHFSIAFIFVLWFTHLPFSSLFLLLSIVPRVLGGGIAS